MNEVGSVSFAMLGMLDHGSSKIQESLSNRHKEYSYSTRPFDSTLDDLLSYHNNEMSFYNTPLTTPCISEPCTPFDSPCIISSMMPSSTEINRVGLNYYDPRGSTCTKSTFVNHMDPITQEEIVQFTHHVQNINGINSLYQSTNVNIQNALKTILQSGVCSRPTCSDTVAEQSPDDHLQHILYHTPQNVSEHALPLPLNMDLPEPRMSPHAQFLPHHMPLDSLMPELSHPHFPLPIQPDLSNYTTPALQTTTSLGSIGSLVNLDQSDQSEPRERNKHIHNVLERKRRKNLNEAFELLSSVSISKKMLPGKLCKRNVITDAISKIRFLKKQNSNVNAELNMLSNTNERLAVKFEKLLAMKMKRDLSS